MQDLIRFCLAIVIVIYHYPHFLIIKPLGEWPDGLLPIFYSNLRLIFEYGYQAVPIFFFFSGFILSTIYGSKNNTASTLVFVKKRLVRIYPLHLATLLATVTLVAVYNLKGLESFISFNDNYYSFIANLLMIHHLGLIEDISFNVPAWSISVEMLCYLIYGFFIINRNKPLCTLFLLVTVGIVIIQFKTNATMGNIGSGLTYFFVGVITAIYTRPKKERIKLSAIIFSVALALSLQAGVGPGLQKVIWLLVMLPAGVALISSIDHCFLPNRPFEFLGKLSFSVYMWHFPVQILFYCILGTHVREFSVEGALFFSYIAATLMISILSVVFLEPGLDRKAKDLFKL